MAYKTELHTHSAEVSDCGRVYSPMIADIYAAAGYTTLVLTNHMSKYTYKNKRFDHADLPWEEKVAYYMQGYHAMTEAAAGRLHVLLGMELRLNTDDNDYLIFGMTEEFMLAHPAMMDTPIKELTPDIHAAGMLIFQAHPFRNDMQVTRPDLLDGIEVYNAHPSHDSRNDIALMWAKKFHLRQTSGTDFHQPSHIPAGGILTERPITTNAELLAVLRGGDYTLIREGRVIG